MFVSDNHCTPASKRSVFSALSHRPSLRVPAALNCAKCQRAILCCQLWPSAHTCAVDFKLPASTPLGPICMSSYSWFTRRKQQADVAHCIPFRMMPRYAKNASSNCMPKFQQFERPPPFHTTIESRTKNNVQCSNSQGQSGIPAQTSGASVEGALVDSGSSRDARCMVPTHIGHVPKPRSPGFVSCKPL